MRRRSAAGLAVFLAAILNSTGCGQKACTPEEYGLADAQRLTPRTLPGRKAEDRACATPRVEVIASDAELRTFYEGLGVLAGPDGIAPEAGAIEYPAVDFARERVIVREGTSQAISWTVAQGETGVLGLIACTGTNFTPTCAVDVVAVPSLIARAEARTCQPVGCGNPQQPPVIQR